MKPCLPTGWQARLTILCVCSFLSVQGLCFRQQFEAHPKDTILIVVADDLEGTYFGGVFNMQSDAQTFIIVAYLDDAYRFGSVFRQALQVESSLGFLLGNESGSHRQVAPQHVVDCLFDAFDVGFGGSCREGKIKFALFPFDVGRYSTSATEEVDHCAVYHVFGGVHAAVFRLVMGIQLRLFFHVYFH